MKRIVSLGLLCALLSGLVSASAPAGPWDAFNFAPDSKTVRPAAIFKTVGEVQNPKQLLSPSGKSKLIGNGSYVTLDFGKEVRSFDQLSMCSCRLLGVG